MGKKNWFFLLIHWLIIISLVGCKADVPRANGVSPSLALTPTASQSLPQKEKLSPTPVYTEEATLTHSPALSPSPSPTPTQPVQITPTSAGRLIFAAMVIKLELREDSRIFIAQSNGVVENTPQVFLPFAKANRMNRQFAVSPDGRYVAFDGASEEYPCKPGAHTDCFTDNYGLFLADLEQEKVIPIAASGVPGRSTYSWGFGPPSWSPDGSRFIAKLYGKLYQYEVQTAKTKLLIKSMPGMHEAFPAWSPDGQWIAFIRLPVDEKTCPRGVWSGLACRIGSLWLVHPDGTGERKLLDDVYFEVPKDPSGFYIVHDFPYSAPVWSPDSQWLALSTGREQPDLTLVNIQTQEIRYLASGPARDLHPSWSPDGKWLAFNSDRTGNEDIFIVSVDGRQLINLTAHPADDYLPTWSPDGRQLAFLSTRDGSWYKLFVMEAVQGAQPCPMQLDYLQINGKPAWFPANYLNFAQNIGEEMDK